MQEFTFYTSADEQTFYCYQVRQRGAVFYVTISQMRSDTEMEYLGLKVLRNITRHEVVQECLSHCRRRSSRQPKSWRYAIVRWFADRYAGLWGRGRNSSTH